VVVGFGRVELEVQLELVFCDLDRSEAGACPPEHSALDTAPKQLCHVSKERHRKSKGQTLQRYVLGSCLSVQLGKGTTCQSAETFLIA
jgi:hypothetical protein